MAKHKQTTKHKKQVKKEQANRKAKAEVKTAEPDLDPLKDLPQEDRSPQADIPDATPMSPARRAFQDV